MKTVLVAHRGVPLHYPENSLQGYRAALEAGATYLETDVQVTADGIPVLSHDPSTLKITGRDRDISTTRYAEISKLPAGHPDRFGKRFDDLRIRRLDEFVSLLAEWPQARAFVELKKAGIQQHGIETVLEIVLQALDPVARQCILICFDDALLKAARARTDLPIGWVLPAWSEETRALAYDLAPAYLFCNRKRLPASTQPLWPGDWRWVLYTANTPEEVQALRERGADMVETDTITTLL